MDITEYLYNYLAHANSVLTALQAEQPRFSKDWNRTVTAIADVRAAMTVITFLPSTRTLAAMSTSVQPTINSDEQNELNNSPLPDIK